MCVCFNTLHNCDRLAHVRIVNLEANNELQMLQFNEAPFIKGHLIALLMLIIYK